MKTVADIAKSLQQMVDDGKGGHLAVLNGGFTLDHVSDLSPIKKVIFCTNNGDYHQLIKDRHPHKTFLDGLI
jgi:hypothetical protein